MTTSSARQTVITVGLLAAGCFAAYWAWLGWDNTYQTDPQTGVASGPYETWQVAGCVLTLAAIAITAGIARRATLAVATMPPAFTAAWAIPAAAEDETGLYGVGAIMILVGMLAGSAVLALGSQHLSALRAAR